MRPVNLADIEAGVQVLLAAPVRRRSHLASELCNRACEAERYRQIYRAAHPEFGTGTLMSAAQAYDKALRGSHENPEFLSCIQLLVAELQKIGLHQNP